MIRPRRIADLLVIVLAGVLLLLASAATAFAAAPPSSGQTILTEGFEAAYPSYLTVSKINLIPPPVSWWGSTTLWSRTGARSLWCAGANATSTLYPDFTYGMAKFDVPQLADYYSAKLSFYYKQPSLGVADADSFNVAWSTPTSLNDSHFHFPLTSSWLLQNYDLTAGTNRILLSRQPGVIKFQFVDINEGFGQSPTRGQGPSIDDVSITGIKYGPVRTPSASRISGGVRVSWAAPYAAIGSSAVETRTVTYRVWRTPDVKPYAWSEVTSATARVSGNSYDDMTASLGGSYRYVVQAWDTGSGAGYGVADTNSTTQTAAHVAATPPSIPRVAGADRIATALLASKAAFPANGSAPAVVIASGWSWTDALPAAALAGTVRGPLLLVRPTSWDTSIGTEINRLGATKVYIVGNTASINSTVRTAIKALGKTTVEIGTTGGTDVYGINQQIASQLVSARGSTGGTVFVARSDLFADALAASSLAAKMKAPIVLVPPTGTTLPAAVTTALQSVQPTNVVICGSGSAVATSVANAIQTATGVAPVRKFGSVRYDTAKALIDYGTTDLNLAPGGPDRIYVCTGLNFPDALAGGVLAGASADGKWRPLMTTPPTSLATQAADYMDGHHSLKGASVLGSDYNPATGAGAVDDGVLTAMRLHLY